MTLRQLLCALIATVSAQAASAYPIGESLHNVPGGSFDSRYINFLRCLDPHFDTERRVAYCRSVIGLGRGRGFDSAVESIMGEIYLNAGAYDKAIVQFGNALTRSSAQPMDLNDRCWARAILAKDLELALADCNAALQAEPDRASYYDSRGLVRYRMGHLAEALNDFNTAISKNPNMAGSLFMRAMIEEQMNEPAQENRDLAAAQAINPLVGDRYADFGIKPARSMPTSASRPPASLGGPSQTAAVAPSAIIEPDTEAGWIDGCYRRALAGDDLDVAQALCEKAVDHQSRNPQALQSRGLVQYRLHHLDAARVDFNAALARTFKLPVAFFMRGIVERRQGNPGEGDKDIETALALDPTVATTFAANGIVP